MATINGRLGLQGTVVIEDTYLRWNITAPTPANFTYGSSSMIPLVGDWNGDGVEGIGVYDPSNSAFHLRQSATGGDADFICGYGEPGDTPISWYDTYSIGFSQGDGIGIIRGTYAHLDKNLGCAYAEIITPTTYLSCPSTISQCKYLCGNIRIHVRDEALNFINGYNFWLDGVNKGEVTSGNRLFDSIDNGSHTCQIIKTDNITAACNYCSGSTTCTPTTYLSNCSVSITIVTDKTVIYRFTILTPCTTPTCSFTLT